MLWVQFRIDGYPVAAYQFRNPTPRSISETKKMLADRYGVSVLEVDAIIKAPNWRPI